LWRMGEPSKDPMTDKPVTVAVLGMHDHSGVLYVGQNGETSSVWILYDYWLPGSEIEVEYRVDDLPPVKETWKVNRRIIKTENNRSLLKAMLAGSRLRIRVGDVQTGVMDFRIAGLQRYASQLGIQSVPR
jgi:hypothetical protein